MNKLITFFQAKKEAVRLIEQHHLDSDVARYLIQNLFHFSNTDLLMNYRHSMNSYQYNLYLDGVKQYLNGEPPQYIVGRASFYGNDFLVNHNVLIPRMETEELVDWLLKSYSNRPLKIVDIGTGSGVIAISLKLNRPKWDVYASDISEAALKVAMKNAELHHTKINFLKSDLFQNFDQNDFDVVISNPPYVAYNEIKYMDKDVINKEPHLALFAKNNGLELYQDLAQCVSQYTKRHASIFLEIGFKQRSAVNQIFHNYLPKAKIEDKNDISNHPRMIKIKY